MRFFIPFFVFLVSLAGGAAQAAVYTVDTTTDSAALTTCADAVPNDCSLRGAVIKANGDAVQDEIIVPASPTPYEITVPNGGEGFNNAANDVTKGDIDVTKPLKMTGGGADKTTIQVTGTGDDRIFHAPTDMDPDPAKSNLEISGLTLTGGKPGANGRGGALMVFGTHNNLILHDSVITGNTATAEGGGFSFENSGNLTVYNTTVSNNTSNGSRGGGMFYETGKGTITNSTFSGNNVKAAGGNDNEGGGGIDATTGQLTLINTTIVGNKVDTAGSIGGGIRFAAGGTGAFTIKNSIFDNNTVLGVSQNCGFKAGANAPVSQGHNLSSDATCTTNFLTNASDKNGVSTPIVEAALAINGGGKTPTHKLPGSTSPAVDNIPTANCTDGVGAPLTKDQNGSTRPTDGNGDGTSACDSGSFELAAAAVTPPPGGGGPGTGTGTGTTTSNAGGGGCSLAPQAVSQGLGGLLLLASGLSGLMVWRRKK